MSVGDTIQIGKRESRDASLPHDPQIAAMRDEPVGKIAK
jgi:hypothetical protein